MNVLSRDSQRMILTLMCRSNGISDIVEITGHSPTTVRRQLARFGEALTATHDRLVRGIAPARIELDELWSYVYAKRWKKVERKKRKRPLPLDVGHVYTWTALDPDSKLLISYHTGYRGNATGLSFMTDLNSRVVGRPLLSTDGYEAYPDLIQRTFGTEMDHVVMQKIFKSWRNPKTGEGEKYLVGLEKVAQNQSKVDVTLASTSLVERLNASIRNYTSRYTRQTYKFSKKLENHCHAFAVFVMYYNFVKPHGGFKGAERHYTPAMKAGLTDKVWSYDNLLDEVDEYWRRKAIQPALQVVPPIQYTPLAVGEITDRPYVVSYSPQKRVAKIHKATCGAGRKKGTAPRMNQWYAFQTERGARQCAEKLAPLQHSVCSICIVGHYAGNIATGRG